ncbi:MAG: hypothetical protein K2J77_04710 [Oscillospiraceae bacterium]|nr:hypothetical protein [Oscillospiraceae bacterium]
MVKNVTLLLIAALVWTAAGVNILRIGIIEYPPFFSLINAILSAVVFVIFELFIFGRLVKKHTKRIDAYGDEKQLWIKFFDVKSFIIMAVMMTGGILLRSLHLAPTVFIAVFYTGLGAALLLAGIMFGRNFLVRIIKKNR